MVMNWLRLSRNFTNVCIKILSIFISICVGFRRLSVNANYSLCVFCLSLVFNFLAMAQCGTHTPTQLNMCVVCSRHSYTPAILNMIKKKIEQSFTYGCNRNPSSAVRKRNTLTHDVICTTLISIQLSKIHEHRRRC